MLENYQAMVKVVEVAQRLALHIMSCRVFMVGCDVMEGKRPGKGERCLEVFEVKW